MVNELAGRVRAKHAIHVCTVYLRPDRTGHLLNEVSIRLLALNCTPKLGAYSSIVSLSLQHYLLPGDFSPTDWLEDPKEPLPRLFAYRNGGSPGP